MTEKLDICQNENRNNISDEGLSKIYDILLELAGGYEIGFDSADEAFEQIKDIII